MKLLNWNEQIERPWLKSPNKNYFKKTKSDKLKTAVNLSSLIKALLYGSMYYCKLFTVLIIQL